MRFSSEAIINASLAAGLVSILGLVDLVGDPLSRHDNNAAFDGGSEVFYVSINEHDAEGRKIDNRYGDALLVLGVGAIAGIAYAASRES